MKKGSVMSRWKGNDPAVKVPASLEKGGGGTSGSAVCEKGGGRLLRWVKRKEVSALASVFEGLSSEPRLQQKRGRHSFFPWKLSSEGATSEGEGAQKKGACYNRSWGEGLPGVWARKTREGSVTHE